MKTFIRKTSILFVTIFFSLINHAQTVEWINTYGAVGGSQKGYGIATDLTGNIYNAGEFSGSGIFGTITLTSLGASDAVVVKNDDSGNQIWIKQFGGSGLDIAQSVITDGSGNSYCSGTFIAPVTFDTFTLTSGNAYVTKLNSNGTVAWAKGFGVNNFLSFAVKLVDATGIYAACSFSGTTVINSSTLTSNGNFDLLIIKLDSFGNVLWMKQMGGAGMDLGGDLTSDNIGNIYFTGAFLGTAIFGSYQLTSAGSYDGFICKLSATGNIMWAKKYGGSGNDGGTSIVYSSSNNIYFAENFTAPVTIGSFSLTAGTSFITKLDTSGVPLWVNYFNGETPGSSTSIANINIDATENIYSTGFFKGQASFGTNTLVAAVKTASGGNDLFVSKLNSSGNFVWLKSLNGTSNEQGNMLTVHSSGKIYVTGQYGNTSVIDSYTLPVTGSPNSFVMKISTTPVGIKENYNNLNVNVYPNPATDKLIIESETFDQTTQLIITDLLGKEILKQIYFNSKTQILDVSALLPGVYFLRINSGEKSEVVKVVKQ